MTGLPRHCRAGAAFAVVAIMAICLAAGASHAADVLPSARSRFDPSEPPRAPGVPDDAQLEANGAVIGEVRYGRINVFDRSIAEEDVLLFRLANRLHIVTRESTLRAQLLFKPGDRFDARLLQESERNLRGNAYLRDARLRPVAYRDGIVDIEIGTQDTWTLKPELSFGRKGGRNTSGFGIEELNLFGLGTQLGLKFKSDVDRDTRTLTYRDPQLGGSRWRLDAQYASNSDGRTQALAVERPFYALDTRWAAGASLRNDARIDPVYDNGRVASQLDAHDRVLTAFGGFSAGLRDGWTTRWTAGITRDERRRSAVDPASPVPGVPAQVDLTYAWVGVEWVEDDFRETRNLDRIGRTEDLALGWRARFKLGVAARALGADRNAAVFGASVANGARPSEQQTVLFTGTASGRLEGGRVANGRFGATARYHWRQTPRRTLFIGLAADQLSNPDAGEQLALGGDNGLRGYPIRYRTGDGRWLFTVEQRVFTDWFPFRLFNVGAAAFFDMGSTWGSSHVASPRPLLPGQQGVLKDIGIGLRLGNSRAALGDVVHIDIAYPLDGDASIRKVQLVVEAKRSF